MGMDYQVPGDLIFVIGESRDDISCSEYLYSYHKVKGSTTPYFDMEKEFIVQQVIKKLIRASLISTCHDVSDGGLYVTLVEKGLKSGLGFEIITDSSVREDAFLFGEAQSRVVVTVNANQEDEFVDYMRKIELPYALLGHVTKGKMVIDDEHFGFIEDAKELYDNVIHNEMEK